MTENTDWNVGRLTGRLAELGLAEDTIVVYLTDNGPNGWRWNGGMKGRKGSTDEGGVRSPLFIRWPRTIESGGIVDRIAGAIDLLPTLAELAGIPYPTARSLDGLSLKPLLEAGARAAREWPERHLVNHWRGSTSVRGQQYRLDDEGRLFDIAADPGQRNDLATERPEAAARLAAVRDSWIAEVLPELPDEDDRPFPIGHPDHEFTHLPARDGTVHGGIERSNRHPNDSYFTNWASPEDAVAWDVEVLAGGRFEVVLYTTRAEDDAGALVELRLGEQAVSGRIDRAHDPPLVGMDDDRVPRIESYVKDFRPTVLGEIDLQTGRGTLLLRALDIPGNQAMDFRLLTLRRLDLPA
jgi:hypothetical protein